ncbi:ParA family partition ATPase [Primorskyibacter sp. S187A]|uniref:ParA family partition ATPase n=1 Tax=Primorskyibacter sp. S187A TaxID=3415130 RepID=UPI003C7BBEAA
MSGQVICIAQQKGGSGKTTLAINLALGFTRAGKSVAVIDTDPQGSMGRWFMTRLERGGEPGLEFATSSAWGVSYEVRKLSDSYDIVIIDTPPKADSDLRPALRAADLALVPLATSHVDLWATESVLDLAQREDVPTLVVMTRGRAGTKLSNEVAAQVVDLGSDVATQGLANRVIYAQTIGEGRAAVEAGASPARTEVDALTAEVAKRLAAG